MKLKANGFLIMQNLQIEVVKKTCLCGHYPIVELCHLTNRYTNEDVVVGNVCVTKFMHVDVPVAQIIPSILRIKDNLSNSINEKLLDVVIDKNLINEWEINFYSNTIRKRKLSFLQEDKRKKINSKIIQSLTKQKGIKDNEKVRKWYKNTRTF